MFCSLEGGSSMYHTSRTGFTIIELMIVIAIIAVLASLMAANIRGNRVQESIVSLTNDIYGTLAAQRTRALSTSRATYVIFNTVATSRALDIYIGNDSRCTPVVSALLGIHYKENNIEGLANQNVGISLYEGDTQMRTLNAASSNNYYENGKPRVIFNAYTSTITITSTTALTETRNATPISGTLSVCFQPNGHTEFYVNNSLNNANSAIISIGSFNGCNDSGGVSEITIDRFGALHSEYVATCMAPDAGD